MAVSIVAEASVARSIPGVEVSARWVCDVFTGSAEALIAAGIVKPGELEPQVGRPEGRMVFLPGGAPCPPKVKAWRQPGHKSIWRLDSGDYQVELTVSKETQAARRQAKRDEAHEREQLRINQELEANGQELRNWRLQHGFSGSPHGGYLTSYEWWEGTKAQLQAQGLGVGMTFPGEPGGPKELYCTCPLGFRVRIHLPGSSYAPGKAAARIYTAQSWYVDRQAEPEAFEEHAAGVRRSKWTPSRGWHERDYFVGTADALIRAGLVPSIELFPGRDGNKLQASYRPGWVPATSSPNQNFGASIRKLSGGEFRLELPASARDIALRKAERDRQERELEQRASELAEERKRLRQALMPDAGEEEFRRTSADELERWLPMLWVRVFRRSQGALSYDMPEGSESLRKMADAFRTLHELVQELPIRRDEETAAEASRRLELSAARSDKGLQSFLRAAKELRLVDPPKHDGQD